MERKYFKYDITVKDIKPIPTHLMIQAFNDVWEWAKKYRGLKNGTDNPFTEEVWKELLETHDHILDTYPYPFVENLLNTFFIEFTARDRAAYTYCTERSVSNNDY